MHRIREDFNNVDDHKDPGGGVLPYLAYTGVCAAKQGIVF